VAVEVNTERKLVEISWDAMVESGPPPEVEPPEEFPPYPDNTLPGDLPHPDQGLPGDQPRPDHELPGDQPEVSHPIYLPPYIDNSLPGGGLGTWGPNDPRPSHPIEIPPDLVEGIPPEKVEALKEFLLGNLPPYEGAPPYPAPTGGKVHAVQVFAQGQDGDWSNTAVMPNDGLAALSYPHDFKGESYVEVRALDGTLVDSGTIKV
jgi:hypothetical protein